MYAITNGLFNCLFRNQDSAACCIFCAAPPISPLFFIPIIIIAVVADTALLPFILVVRIGRTLLKVLKKK